MASGTDLVDELERQGFEVRRTKKGHYFVTKKRRPREDDLRHPE